MRGLPAFPPFYGPGAWWRFFLGCRLEGLPEDESVSKANRLSGLRARDWMRLRLSNGAILTLPVEGGASALKNRDATTWRLAGEAGRESRKAEATLATLYGRLPYFSLLHHVTGGRKEGEAASEVCLEAFRCVNETLGLSDENLLKGLREAMASGDRRLRDVVREAGKIYGSDSTTILELLFRAGPDAIFALLPAF